MELELDVAGGRGPVFPAQGPVWNLKQLSSEILFSEDNVWLPFSGHFLIILVATEQTAFLEAILVGGG